MTASKLQVTSDLAEAAVLLHRHGLITEAQGQQLIAGVFNAEPQEDSYRPVFYFLMDDKEFWSIYGWQDEVADVGAEIGKEAVAFIMGRPKYNTITRLDDLAGWCICCRRGVNEKAMPRIVKSDASPMSKKRKKKDPEETLPEADDNPLMG